LTREKQRLLIEEEARFEELDGRVRAAVAEAFLDGTAFFRAQQFRPKDLGAAFGSAISALATRVLPDLYPHFSEIAVTPSELNQLLEKELTGPSPKFMDGGLGILSLDAGRYLASCTGLHPTRLVAEIKAVGGLTGQTLIATFVSPPYGYAPDLVKACCAGLLRGKKIRIRPEQGEDITSFQDPGVRDLFARDRDFRRAEFFLAIEGDVSQRDRIAISKLFKTFIDVTVDPDDEPIADAAFQYFPGKRERLREVEQRFNDLPGRPALPQALQKLGRALEDCCRSRLVMKTVVEIKRNLDTLRDGIEQLGVCYSELTGEAVETVAAAARIQDNEVAQLRQMDALAEVAADAEAIAKQLDSERPWREFSQMKPAIDRVRGHYVEYRRNLLNRQNASAEAARARVKTRSGFERLDADQAHHVLRPIAKALVETTPEAIAPTLSELRSAFVGSIQRAEDLANDRLDEALGEMEEAQVVKVEAQIRGREVKSRIELKAVLAELEERIGPLVDKGARVRIV
jgi:hypothetical protein